MLDEVPFEMCLKSGQHTFKVAAVMVSRLTQPPPETILAQLSGKKSGLKKIPVKGLTILFQGDFLDSFNHLHIVIKFDSIYGVIRFAGDPING